MIKVLWSAVTGHKPERNIYIYRLHCFSNNTRNKLTTFGSFHMCTNSTPGSACITKPMKPANRVTHHSNLSSEVEPFRALSVPAAGRHCSSSQSGLQKPSGFFRKINGLAPAFSNHFPASTLDSLVASYCVFASLDTSHFRSCVVLSKTCLC